MTAADPTRWTIRSGGHEAVIGRRGAGLCGYTVDGVDVTDPLGEQEVPEAYHGLVLAPWPNRVPDGRWSWAGQELQLPVNEVPTGCSPTGRSRSSVSSQEAAGRVSSRSSTVQPGSTT